MPTSTELPTSEAVYAPRNYRVWYVLATFVLLALFIYRPSLNTPFIFDDDRTVSMNENIMHLWPADWLTKETRPVGALSFALNYQVHGLSVVGFHVTNTVIHALGAWVLFLLLALVLRLPGKDALSDAKADALALAVALLWLVHPLNTQAVSYIAQRYESQMGLFFLLTLYCLARGSLAIGGQKLAWYGGAIAAAWLGMGSKEVMCTVLLVAPLFDRAFLATSWKNVLQQRGWVYAAITPALALLLIAQRSMLAPGAGGASAGFALQSVTPWEYFRTQPEIILHYLGISLIPKQLIFDYAWPVQNELGRAAISGLILSVIFLGSVALYVKRPRWGFAALSFFLILGPTSSFMPIADLAVEHRMYLPLISVCAAVVFLVYAWLEKLVPTFATRKSWALAIAGIAVLMLSVRTYVRNEDYAQPIRLYLQNVRFNPSNRRAHNNLASEFKLRGMIQEAREQYQASIRLQPDHAYAYFQLGLLAAEEHDYAAALPYFIKSFELDSSSQAAGYCLGLCQMELQNDVAAADAFRGVLEADPTHFVSRRELAWVLSTSTDDAVRDGKQGLAMAKELLALRPQDPRLLEVAAAAFAETGNFDQATAYAEQALAVAGQAGWSSPKCAGITAALAKYREQLPWRRSEKES